MEAGMFDERHERRDEPAPFQPSDLSAFVIPSILPSGLEFLPSCPSAFLPFV